MISTDFSYEEYETRRVERHKAEGLRFVPEDTGPKVFCVVCKNASDWNEIHDYIINENEIDGIPNRKIDCSDECKTSDRMASYVISDAEAEQLKNHPKVFGVDLDVSYYSGTFKGRNDFPESLTDRYGSDVKVGRNFNSSFWDSTPNPDELSRTGASLYRHQQQSDPWYNISDSTNLSADPQYLGDGTDVDICVCDDSAWYGHIEFIKTGVGEPTNFVGENVLKSGFATYSETGVCGVLDMVLDSPYYLDPDFFEANGAPHPDNNTSSRLTTRWDGTVVPKEQDAINWWRNESTSYRSAKYVSTNISGGTAVIGSNEDFGVIYVNTSQTRARQNGSNTTQHTGAGFHATPCMSQAYGKTAGWAFNANKWHMNINWGTGSQTATNCFKIHKVFHNNKPNRSSDSTKNPTVTSHSWSRRYYFYNNWYMYFRTPGDGTAGTGTIQQISVSGNSISPECLDNFYYNNRVYVPVPTSTGEYVAGSDMIDAGVIMVGAGGNNNQKQVLDNHPDYNNYISNTTGTTLNTALTGNSSYHFLTNRVNFPDSIGLVENYQNSGVDKYRSFHIGALNSDKSSTTSEKKASYSNCGEAIDCFAIGDNSFSGCDDYASSGGLSEKDRYDSTYRIDSNYNIVTTGGTLSDDSHDCEFGGTSSACPVAAGLLATKLQHQRSWTWEDLKDWLENQVTVQSSSLFTDGTEATTINDSNWASTTNLHGAARRIIWDAELLPPATTYTLTGPLNITGSLNITT